MASSGKKKYDSFTKSLLHFNGANTSTTFTDELGKIWTPTSAMLVTSQSKFGGACAVFNGTTWIDTPDHADFALGSGDFTFDFWLKRAVVNTVIHVFGQVDSGINPAPSSMFMYIPADNIPIFSVCINSTSQALSFNATIADTTVWHHIAIVRSGAILSTYLDGVFCSSVNIGVTGSGIINDSSSKFSIGRSGEYTGNPFNGYIDEFRFSKGIARWTANFTPPTAEY